MAKWCVITSDKTVYFSHNGRSYCIEKDIPLRIPTETAMEFIRLATNVNVKIEKE